MRLYELAKQVEKAESLDGPAEKLAGTVAERVPPGQLKDALTGAWLGHSVHPMLTDVPLGAWMSACILDVVGGGRYERACRVLIAAGIAASVPTAASGAVDWSDTVDTDRRVGLVHAGLNLAATGLYAASLLSRLRGKRRLGVSLGLAGGAATLAGAYLGGHLTLTRGVGVEHTAFEEHPTDWTPVITVEELPDREPTMASVDGTAVLLYRRGDEVLAIANRCGHFGGPLNEGNVDGDTVECPWHGTIYDMCDGRVVRGPARAPQPCYDTRVTNGKVEIKLKG